MSTRELEYYKDCYGYWRSLRDVYKQKVDGYIDHVGNSLPLDIASSKRLEKTQQLGVKTFFSFFLTFKFNFSLRPFFSQYPKLAKALEREDGISIIALASIRTEIKENIDLPREFLKSLSTSFDSGNRPMIMENKLENDILIIVDASRDFYQTEHLNKSNKDNVFLLNPFFISLYFLVFLIRKPIESFTYLYKSIFISLRNSIHDKDAELKHLITIFFSTYVFKSLFKDTEINIFNFTSNSILADSLKFFGLQNKHCSNICEILHGINHKLVNSYHENLIHLTMDNYGFCNLNFINHIPNLPKNGVTSLKLLHNNDPIVNIQFNALLRDSDFELIKLEKKLIDDVSKLYTHPNEKKIIIGYIGYTDVLQDFTLRKSFAIEKYFLNKIRSLADDLESTFDIIYSPHPMVNIDQLKKEEIFKEGRFKFSNSTMRLNFFSDLSFALISGALFEARTYGSCIYSPMTADQDYFFKEIHNLLDYPETYSELDIESSIKKWLKKKQPLDFEDRKGLIRQNLLQFNNWI